MDSKKESTLPLAETAIADTVPPVKELQRNSWRSCRGIPATSKLTRAERAGDMLLRSGLQSDRRDVLSFEEGLRRRRQRRHRCRRVQFEGFE
jgi:hypothetical protein